MRRLRALWPGRRRDALIRHLAGQLAESRAREAGLRERLSWYQALTGTEPRPDLRLVNR